MLRFLKISLLAALLLSLNTSCFKDNDDELILTSSINDFVWKGMNAVYLYKAEIPDLANDRFTSNQEYSDYLNSFALPEDLFESVIYQRETVDRFSWITNDYIALEQQLSGVYKSNGLEYNFYYKPGSTTSVFGIIKLVLNNSVASGLGLERGQIFDAVDGTALTADNLNSLLGTDSYTLNLATYDDNGTPDNLDDDAIVSSSESVSLTKQPYTENPVYLTKVLDVAGEKVGYLMYNSFTANYDSQLNDAFATFQSNNVQDLVLDLRYNGGGSVNTASLLGSMITGDFTGDVFSKLIYNEQQQANNKNYNFTTTLGNGGSSINSLHLNRLYVLTSSRTASASEMIINSLKEYITVIQIGDTTTGKSQFSRTIYDSPTFGPNDINPSHTYAMQPLIGITVNKNDGQVPATGLVPDEPFILKESPRNFGVLGDVNEPLLARAIQHISGLGRLSSNFNTGETEIKNTVDAKFLDNDMYLDADDAETLFQKSQLNH